MIERRIFLGGVVGGALSFSLQDSIPAFGSEIESTEAGEDLFRYLERTNGKYDRIQFLKLLGAANEFKEGDQIIEVAASDEAIRQVARTLLANTRIVDIDKHPLFDDQLAALLRGTRKLNQTLSPSMTVGELKRFLLERSEGDIHSIMNGLSSETIACVVKLMSNAELIAVGSKVFNPLPNSKIGGRGYLGARIQPNSPTDHVDDIRWQVFNAFAFAVGDVLLGTNPVSSDVESVAAIERTLQDILHTFSIQDAMPHCVLSHIDVQAEVEKRFPGSTELWFQSIAGNDAANQTFDLTVEKMVQYARERSKGNFGLYFETGQGADFTNGHGQGCDMVILESRKYGFARALSQIVSESRAKDGKSSEAWVHVNDVAGFIGPEVFRSKEQLVRCCLEDIVMGKLHGLTIGLDVCSTLHMDVSLADLDWCLEQVAPANPAYLMALPTKIDPMLGYLTTGYQDHVRLRERFGLRVNDRMWSFFKQLGLIDERGKGTKHFGDPLWVYYQYRLRKGDTRSEQEIIDEGKGQMELVRRRGVFLTRGYGANSSDLTPDIQKEIESIYQDAKKCIWKEWDPAFTASLPNSISLRTLSTDRTDYILHPLSGEQLSADSLQRIQQLRKEISDDVTYQIVVSDGLNANACMEPNQLQPLINGIREGLHRNGKKVSPNLIVLHAGRVRAGYRIGENLFRGIDGKRSIIHIIGERPGSGHRTLSVYLTTADGSEWSVPARVDHNITKVVSGISTSTLLPENAATECVKLLI